MKKIEMLIGYDANNFEKKFNDNFRRISLFMYNYFKTTLGDKVAGMNVEQNVLFSWTYYFLTLADESKEVGNNVMLNMLKHFDHLINSDEDIEIKGTREKGQLLLLDESFCRIWFKTSICGMIAYIYGKENVMDAIQYLDENYFNKNKEFRTMLLHEPDKVTEA
ncbi:hypothetical protein [Clostridium fallax]|uniref:Uncharacterized protein n=1 Tax=Clostridium fallax TaxID=1533 RepID=A0A1M4W4H1_9CLOT|nr:hypothetical protein [Clostridium fallax]SHE75852.1 hypothetical protein SAMN05443638_11044 [Clostridium fallax]SQB22864.1 Uncharacterised protein [Clostridium fallax]